MSRKKTFIDAGVLITAARGEEEVAVRAMQILDDPNREFVASPFLKLEVLPKAVYNRQQAEVDFYEAFFAACTLWAESLDTIVAQAQQQANTFGGVNLITDNCSLF